MIFVPLVCIDVIRLLKGLPGGKNYCRKERKPMPRKGVEIPPYSQADSTCLSGLAVGRQTMLAEDAKLAMRRLGASARSALLRLRAWRDASPPAPPEGSSIFGDDKTRPAAQSANEWPRYCICSNGFRLPLAADRSLRVNAAWGRRPQHPALPPLPPRLRKADRVQPARQSP